MVVNFLDFISQNKDGLYNFLIKLSSNPADAEDILQNVLIKISESISDVKEPDKIRTWAYTIATNAAMDYFRQHGKAQLLEYDDEILLPSDTNQTIEDLIITDEMNKCIREKIDTIPVNYRTALILFYFEKLPITEIATICGTTASSIKVRLLRAKEMMNRVLNNHCNLYYENNKFKCCQKEIKW
jgi:RNA polymerase sigma-70 factor (ECF subfamily)